jgi:DNA mismatch repair protein MutS
MTALAGKLDGAHNATVAVKEWENNIIFLHEIRKGTADRSYGVQVAKLAGLPQSVTDRAKTVLQMLEQNEQGASGKHTNLVDDLPLFSSAPAPVQTEASDLDKRMGEINPDELTPREAMQLIYELKTLGRRS